MSITERLANLSIPAVLAIVVVLLAIRFVLIRQKTPTAKWFAETAESLAIALALVFLIIRPFIVQAFFIPSESMLPGLRVHDHLLVNKFLYRVVREPKPGDVIVFRAPIDAMPGALEAIISEADSRGLEGEKRDAFIEKQIKKNEKDFIKRVIALPGDLVRVTPGYVKVDESRYDHRDLRDLLRDYTASGRPGPVKLNENGALVGGHAVSKEQIAKAIEAPASDVKIVPGKVYVNGKALREPYTAEDPDLPYPLAKVTSPEMVTTDKQGHFVVKVPEGRILVMGDNRNESNDSRFWPSGPLDRKRVLGKALVNFWPLNRVKLVR